MEFELYLKYGFFILLVITVLLTMSLYRTYYMSKNRRQFRKIVVVIFSAFICANIFLIYILQMQLSILYKNVLAPAICISFSTVIFLKPKEL